MTATITWAIANLDRSTADGKVNTVHYTVNAEDGTYSAGAYGSIGLDGDIATPFKDLTADVVVSWVKDHFGAEKVAEIEQALIQALDNEKAPKVLSGVPW